jgi:hypothetical protein
MGIMYGSDTGQMRHQEGSRNYRRFIRAFSTSQGVTKVLLQHKLGRYPLFGAFELLPVVGKDYATENPKFAQTRMLPYYGHDEAHDLGTRINVYDEHALLGIPLAQLLEELNRSWTPGQEVQDVVNDLWEALFNDPATDDIPHQISPGIREFYNRRCTVDSLMKGGEWDDIRVAIKPRLLGYQPDDPQLEIVAIDYDTVSVTVTKMTTDPLYLMFVMQG